MNVLHVINIHGFGGAEKLLLVSLPALKKKGLNVHCLIFHRQGIAEAANKLAGELRTQGIAVSVNGYKRSWESGIFSTITNYIGKNQINLVHSHLKYADLWLSVLRKRKKIRVPVITTLHGYRDSYQNRHGLTASKGMRFTPYYWLTRFVCRELDGYVCISECLKNFYTESGLLKNKPVKVIYHGYEIRATGFPIVPSKAPDPLIAIPGRLIKMKGHQFALEAFKELLVDHPKATLHLFGSGPEEQAIRNQVQELNLQERVQLHGYVSDLPERLKNFHIALLPSLWESFGIVFLDAFAAGVPVVAFDLPAGNEIVVNGETGILVAPRDSQALATAMKKLLADSVFSDRIAKHAWEQLNSRFSADMMADNYLKFYTQLVN